ncbi:putative bifunctional diguanylate cyclase/phosphodiesterase [Henriciella litoralis]|uniref:putative bifunctional diguanylate cyclase/phosphodiesterase n=1 Tax=Henriciella litoralis TaxID=568102 RepID=UPI000A00761D|nr:GGDEF domain-containing phosphodiesterase [Henriciella litoralis]
MRFANVVPVVAAIFALVSGMLFAGVYLVAAEMRASQQSDEMALRVVETLRVDLEAGRPENATRTLTSFAPEHAYLLDERGELIGGDYSDRAIAHGRVYPITADGKQLGELVMVRLMPFRPPLPGVMAVFCILVLCGTAYAMANYFSKLAGRQVEEITRLTNHLSLNQKAETNHAPLVYREFRLLRAAIVRQLRNLQAENRRLKSAAYTDERTGLGNSARLTRKLTQFISRSSFSSPAAFILIDADGMQQFSDSHDAATTLEMHTAFARRFSKIVSEQEAALSLPHGHWPTFSLQSDEFGILVDRVGARPEVIRLARQVLDELREPYSLAGKMVRLPAHAGIVMIPEDGQTPADIRKRASSALLQARRVEGSDMQFYSPKLDRQNAARKRLEAEVLAAVEAERFIPMYQPKVDLQTGKIVGAEALARWKLESGRIVSPNIFIPVAESCGMIGDIGRQIARKACEDAARWNSLDFDNVSIAVNVSPLQFESDDLGEMVINAMTDAGLPPRLLQLEITESVAVEDPDRLKDVINPLKSMGVRLAIDDFGTGHSNLSMLGRLPFDVFKIDRQFISNLHTDRQAPAIVEMILGMAETLGMETVAEGVETEAQLNFLRRRGCDQYQGYYFSPPVMIDRFMEMLSENNQSQVA